MNDYLYILLGLAVGGGLGYLIARLQTAGKLVEWAALRAKVPEWNELESQLNEAQIAITTGDANLESAQRQIRILNETNREIRSSYERQWADKLSLLEKRFETLSARIFEEKTRTFKEGAVEQMTALLNPVREKFEEFRRQVEESREKGIQMNSALAAQIRAMRDETERVGNEANLLAKALTGNNKMQGNWGEMVLATLLEHAGLTAGREFELQKTLRDTQGNPLRNEETGRRMIPDAVVHYPDGTDLILDSKVSLTAYTDFVNAPDDDARQAAASRHMVSVQAHVKELSDKDYARYIQTEYKNSVNFVLMFVPNEGAYSLALQTRPTLWQEACDARVLMVSPVNLMAVLRLVQLAWTRDDQSRNQELIIAEAENLLGYLHDFYDAFDRLGESLDRAQTSYQDAARRITSGPRSMISSGEKLRKFGVQLKKEREVPKRLKEE